MQIRSAKPVVAKKKYKPRATQNTKGEKDPYNPEEIAACLNCRVPGECRPGHVWCAVQVRKGAR